MTWEIGGSNPCKGKGIFLLKTSIPALGPTQLIFKGYRVLTGVKRPVRDVRHSPPSSEWRYTPASPICLRGVETENFQLFLFSLIVVVEHKL